MKQLKVIVERHPEGFVAYPIGLNGVIVGEGNTLDEALKDLRSAIRFHIETFGRRAFEDMPSEVVLADIAFASR